MRFLLNSTPWHILLLQGFQPLGAVEKLPKQKDRGAPDASQMGDATQRSGVAEERAAEIATFAIARGFDGVNLDVEWPLGAHDVATAPTPNANAALVNFTCALKRELSSRAVGASVSFASDMVPCMGLEQS